MLTRAEQTRGLAAGAASLLLIGLFVTLPTAALLMTAPDGLGQTLFDAYTLSILRFTLLQAVLSTFLSVLLAVPVALSLARRSRFPGRIWIIRLMAVPMGLPVLIGALGLIGIFGRQGLLNDLLTSAGLRNPVSIYGLTGILIAHVFFNLPLAARLMLAGLERLPPETWRLSASLGLSSWSTFRFVERPALAAVIPGAAGLIFMLCATSFTLVLVLGGGPAATTLEVAIYQSLRFDFDPPRAVMLALLQIALTAIILLGLGRFATTDRSAGGEGRAPKRFDGRDPAALAWDTLVILLATLFLLLPLASIVVSGWRADLGRLITMPAFRQAALTSLSIALTAALLSLLMAGGIIKARSAIADRRHQSKHLAAFSTALATLSSLVLLVPPVVLGTGWFLLIRPFGQVTSFAPFLIAAINALMALPFVMRVLEPAVETHVARTRRLSASLGIGGISRLRLIDWPGLRRPLFMALSFAMALSLGDLGAVALFGSNDLTTLPWLIYSRLGSYRTHDADGLALILGVICLILTALGTVGHKEKQ
ncbi:thiamine/thiamine pyrophosphate ABC transporter permease [Rhizobium sp. SL86]|uniref:thiamine/thiamine pyrophosphate ABC transporter permease n=1 Tax=Rhizobium sp. SL86 TaxID=2995148 RepID=UPI002275A66F|nr:thiamine/thiamine pyrophosphate ABC transporter permease [Rhizobium sp. SL86]MCY1665574.1 thiamine/thiamine pyrophosphate ABC transporter permease [Rhizobium sp. SL86]